MYRHASDPAPIRWEYKSVVASTLRDSTRAIDGKLNEQGAGGWELVSFTATPQGQLLFVLKRQLM